MERLCADALSQQKRSGGCGSLDYDENRIVILHLLDRTAVDRQGSEQRERMTYSKELQAGTEPVLCFTLCRDEGDDVYMTRMRDLNNSVRKMNEIHQYLNCFASVPVTLDQCGHPCSPNETLVLCMLTTKHVDLVHQSGSGSGSELWENCPLACHAVTDVNRRAQTGATFLAFKMRLQS